MATDTLTVHETPGGWRAELAWSTDPMPLPVIYGAWFIPAFIIASLFAAAPPLQRVLAAAIGAGLLTAIHAGLVIWSRREPAVLEREGDWLRAHRYGRPLLGWPEEGVPVGAIDGASASQEQILIRGKTEPLRIPCQALAKEEKEALVARVQAAAAG